MSSASSSAGAYVAAQSDALCSLVWKMPDLRFKQVFPKYQCFLECDTCAVEQWFLVLAPTYRWFSILQAS